jgi:hypothetical protein
LVADFPPVGALRAKLGVDMADPEEEPAHQCASAWGDEDHEIRVTLMYSIFEYN